MNFISQITRNHTYNYFDNSNQLQTKRLNFLQNIFRNLFGFYSETHSLNVIKKVYSLTLNGTFQGYTARGQKQLEVIAKAEKKYGAIFAFLGKKELASGKTLEISTRYVPIQDNSSFNIETIEFKIKFAPCNDMFAALFKQNDYFMHFAKTRSNLLRFESHPNIFHSTFNEEERKIMNNIVIKILQDSKFTAMHSLHFYHKDFTIEDQNEEENHGSEVSNNGQQQAMERLQWGYLRDHQEENTYVENEHAVRHVDKRRIYQLNPDNMQGIQSEVSQNFKNTFSIAYAMHFLKKDDKEFSTEPRLVLANTKN